MSAPAARHTRSRRRWFAGGDEAGGVGRLVVLGAGGAGATVLGDRLILTALAIVVSAQGGPGQVALVLSAQTVAMLTLIALGGVWADRLPRALAAAWCDVARAGAVALVALAAATGGAQNWMLGGAAAALGGADALSLPAISAMIAQLATRSQLQRARSLVEGAEQTAGVLGPALAGLLLAAAGASLTLAAGAVVFVLSAVLFARVHASGRCPAPTTESEGSGLAGQLVQGARALADRRWLVVALAAMAVGVMCCQAPLFVLGPTVCEQQYGSYDLFGLLIAALGAGAILGALAASRTPTPHHPLRAAFLICAPWTIITLALALHAPPAILLACALASGVMLATFTIYLTTTIASHTPEHLMARITSFQWAATLLLLPVGMLLTPLIAALAGNTTTLIAGAAITTIALTATQLSPTLRNLTNTPQKKQGPGDKK